MLDSKKILEAYNNIRGYVTETPLITSPTLNNMLGHELYFKLENLQKTGSYKVRGCFNSLLSLAAQKKLPKKVTAYSTGNHGLGLAYAAKKFSVQTDLYLPAFTSKIKQIIAQKYGANIIYTKTRGEAEEFSKLEAQKEKDVTYLPPSDLDSVILGAGTVTYEALLQEKGFDSAFVPIGGGGLAAGSYLAKQLHNVQTKIFLSEPKQANDVSISLKTNKLFKFESSPETIADGARTLGISNNIFQYIKKCDGIFEISEREIVYWTAWFTHLTKMVCEPTSALALAAAYRWLKKEKRKRKILIIITGGNLDSVTYNKIWAEDHLLIPPNQFIFDKE